MAVGVEVFVLAHAVKPRKTSRCCGWTEVKRLNLETGLGSTCCTTNSLHWDWRFCFVIVHWSNFFFCTYKMRGRFKRKDPRERKDETANPGAGFCAPPGEPAARSEEPHRPVPGFSVQDVGSKKKGRAKFWQTTISVSQVKVCSDASSMLLDKNRGVRLPENIALI